GPARPLSPRAGRGVHHGRVVGLPPGGPVRVEGPATRPARGSTPGGGGRRRGLRRRGGGAVGSGSDPADGAVSRAGRPRRPPGRAGDPETRGRGDERSARATAGGGGSRGLPRRVQPVPAAVTRAAGGGSV